MAYYGRIPVQVDSNLNATWPSQCSFSAYANTPLTDVTGDGTAYTIILNTEIFDIGSNFNTGTGTFTAPKTGKYFFGFSITPLQLGAAHTGGNVLLVTSNRTYAGIGLNFGAVRDVGNGAVFNGNFLVDMDVNDTATLRLTISGSTKTVDLFGEATNVWTGFWGYLLG